MIVRPVSYAEILDAPNASALLSAYSAECSIPMIGGTNPQTEMYARMEQSGMFQAFGAFSHERLVGLAALIDFTLPHYGERIANVESLFIEPEQRSLSAMHLLMDTAENHGRNKECKVISYSAKTGSNFERLLSLLKPYQRTNAVFMRSLQPPRK